VAAWDRRTFLRRKPSIDFLISAPNAVAVDRSHDPRTDLRGGTQHASTLFIVLGLIGFTAVIAQIVLMRELMVVFHGNEMSLGWMLASWLLWTAIGSSAFGRLATRTTEPQQLVALSEVLLAVSFPSAIYLVRSSKVVFQSVPGEILGPGPMILTSLVVLSIFCLVSGGLFAAGSRLYAGAVGTSTFAGATRVYLLEAAGSGLGGFLASLVLIRHFEPFQIAALLSLLNLFAATILVVHSGVRRAAVVGVLIAVFVFFVFPFACRRLEEMSLSRLWHGYHLLANRNSVYGNLAVVQTESIRSLFENGLVSAEVPDPMAAEEAVHFALLQHPSPKSLLLVGGGVNGSLRQALQYSSLERVDYVELDPELIKLADQFFPEEWMPARTDPRVHVHNTDGRLFLKRTDLKFDVIIINLPDPQTAQLNRFYTLEFFQEVGDRLTPNGIFSFQLKGAEDYIGPELAEFLRCIHKTLRSTFLDVLVIPGETVQFLASPQSGSLTLDSAELVARLRARHIQTTYLREYYLPYRMTPDRIADLESQLLAQPGTRINRDFAPVAYYFDVALWSTRFNRAYRQIFQAIGHVRFGPFVATAGLALFALAAIVGWLPKSDQRIRPTVGFCVAAMGFTLIGLEILLLLAFQAIYGYVYHQLAILIAGFMVGMSLGSWFAMRRERNTAVDGRDRTDMFRVVKLQFFAAVSSMLLYLLLQAFAASNTPSTVFVVSQIIFPLLAVFCGLLGGYQFPIASRLFFAKSTDKESSPGTLYALDLAGSCLGALVLSSYLVPVFGFAQTAWLMAVVNLAPAILVGWLAVGKTAGQARTVAVPRAH
jgi:spermidine synthase